MSWEAYRDSLTGCGHVKSAAVVGHEGGVWTASPGFNVTQDEIKGLLAGFSNPGSLQANGVVVGGVKYMFIVSDDFQIQGKKGATGVSIAKGSKCLVIGAYGEGQQAGSCRASVEKICDHLKGSGY